MSYVPEAYDSLPSLHQAGKLFEETKAKDYLLGPIRQLFLDHDLYMTYGISLLHKHFPIEATQRLVDYRHSATAWEIGSQTASKIAKYEAFAVPRAFRFFGGKLTPYEFEFSETIQSEEEHKDFFEQLSDLLHQHNLQDLFGLRLLGDFDPALPMEVTEGKTNIMMPRG
jgi:hypothetical protein